MARIPENFRRNPPILANYDAVDIASGTGYVTFYGGRMGINGTIAGGNTSDLYVLSPEQFYSDTFVSNGAAFTGTAFLKNIDLDFDIMFNLPRTLKGQMIVNLTMGRQHTQTTLKIDMYPIIYVRKWDGSTETAIANATGNEFRPSVDTTGVYLKMACIPITIPTTHFKRGDFLRVTIELWGKTDSASLTGVLLLGNDPMGRLTQDGLSVFTFPAGYTSLLSVHAPFRMDL